jgi:hypothetical protein
MNNKIAKVVAVGALFGTLAGMSIGPAQAAQGRNAAFAAGVAAGALGGAALGGGYAGPAYGGYYGGPSYAYGPYVAHPRPYTIGIGTDKNGARSGRAVSHPGCLTGQTSVQVLFTCPCGGNILSFPEGHRRVFLPAALPALHCCIKPVAGHVHHAFVAASLG